MSTVHRDLVDDHKVYLGDGVHADFDGYHVVLTVEDGISTTSVVYLEPDVFASLLRYHEQLMEMQARMLALDLEDVPPPAPELP